MSPLAPATETLKEQICLPEQKVEAPTVTFSPSQKAALPMLEAWWKSGEKNFILSGEPGTGKTFLTKYFLSTLQNCVPLFTAPTNEAVRQLQIALRGTKAVTKTTYSALGLRLSLYSKKQSIFQGRVPEDLDDFNLLVVDESSMASERFTDKDKMLLMDFVKASGMRTIWIGDWAQLPPVDTEKACEHSPVFQYTLWPQIDLVEVQRHKGPILELASRFRKIIGSGSFTLNLPEIPEGIAVQKLNGTDCMSFTEEQYTKLSEDKARIICWTNQATPWNSVPGVKEYNQLVRNWIFGRHLAEKNFILQGDRVLFSSPLFSVKNPDKVDLEKLTDVEFTMEASVNSRAEVIKVEKELYNGVDCYKMLLSLEDSIDTVAWTPSEAGLAAYKTLCEFYASQAKDSEDSHKAAKWWEQYHLFTQLFAHVKHTYCITAHRSQGSSIPEVYVDLRNILQNKKQRLTAFKAAYVAITRAQNFLMLGMR